MSPSARSLIGLFGKIPTHGDYVRLNAAEPAPLALFDWVQAALDHANRSGEKAPAVPVHFALPMVEQRVTLVGSLGPSRDSVGRVFPLVVFNQVEMSVAANSLASLLLAAVRFTEETTTLLRESASLTPQALLERARAIAPISADDIEEGAAELSEGLANIPAAALENPSFAALGPGEGTLALGTLLSTCRPLAQRDPPRSPPMLDSPVVHDSSRIFWVESTTRLLRWRGTHPAVLWTYAPSPRALIVLGVAAASAMVTLLNPTKAGPRLVTLRSGTGPALAAAAPLVADAEAKLAHLLDSLVRAMTP